MPAKIHIPVHTANPRFHPVGQYTTIEYSEDCAGSCRECVKKKCVYQIFKDNRLHIAKMTEPEYLYTCQSCFRCVQECTRGIFSRVVNPDYRTLGDRYWRPEMIHSLWYQAHTGKIPVSGAGYRGPFVGEGFDRMWTDMSEIVRPTRDGIHGREFISTGIEISRRLSPLQFKPDGTLLNHPPPVLEMPVPLLFRLPQTLASGSCIQMAALKAAAVVGTQMILEADACSDYLQDYADQMIPSLPPGDHDRRAGLIAAVKGVEIECAPEVEAQVQAIRSINPQAVIIVRMPLDDAALERTQALARMPVDALFFFADDHARGLGSDARRSLRDGIRDIHRRLVDQARRPQINLLFSGGIALAEHMAKAIICGADGVILDIPLLVALECRLCYGCREGRSCPAALDASFDTDWGRQRIVNLVAAWHSQLIEVMGAMGIRDVRRLRGEIGRSMWFEDLEKENFAPVFGERRNRGKNGS